MKRFFASWLVAAALAVAVNAQFTPVAPGATKVVPSWGPPPPDITNQENVKAFSNRVAYLSKKGFTGSVVIRIVQLVHTPGFPEPPAIPFVVFSCSSNAEESIHNYELFLKSPAVTLTELKNHCGFGDPKILEPFEPYEPGKPQPGVGPTPLPGQPANPVGAEVLEGSGKYFVVPGDKNPAGFVFTASDGKRYRKVVRPWPFGQQSWYELLP